MPLYLRLKITKYHWYKIRNSNLNCSSKILAFFDHQPSSQSLAAHLIWMYIITLVYETDMTQVNKLTYFSYYIVDLSGHTLLACYSYDQLLNSNLITVFQTEIIRLFKYLHVTRIKSSIFITFWLRFQWNEMKSGEADYWHTHATP
jgi:hypothetical protein